MEASEWLRIIISGLFGSLGFALLFKVSGKRVVWATLGGTLTCVAYAACLCIFEHEFFINFIPALVGAIFSEVMARITKSPVTPYIVCAIIPLVPGGKLYYTMYYIIIGEMDAFRLTLRELARISAGLAVGVICVSAIVHMINHNKFKQIYDME